LDKKGEIHQMKNEGEEKKQKRIDIFRTTPIRRKREGGS